MSKPRKKRLGIILTVSGMLLGGVISNFYIDRISAVSSQENEAKTETSAVEATTSPVAKILKIGNFETTTYKNSLNIYQNKRDTYLTLKARYDRLGYEDLRAGVLTAAKELLIARNRVAQDYSAWLSTVVNAYVDEKAMMTLRVDSTSDASKTANVNTSTTLNGETDKKEGDSIALNGETDKKEGDFVSTTSGELTQTATESAEMTTAKAEQMLVKEHFLGRISSLQGLLEWEAEDINAISSWEDWASFSQEDNLVTTFQSRLYPILTYLVLQEISQDLESLKAVFPVVEKEVLATTSREVVKEEEQKILEQNFEKLAGVEATLTEWKAVWLEVNNEATYNNFMQVVAGLTAKQKEVIGSLDNLYSLRNK